MSPEIVRKVYYEGFMADIWASGVVLYSMITGDFPFKGKLFNHYY
jgi:serine/threonine protein kinase